MRHARHLALVLAATALPPAMALAQQTGQQAGEQTGLNISGDARMGLVYDRAPAWAGQRETGLRMTARTRLHLEFLGQTDGGLNFGAGITLDSDKRRPTSPWVAIGG
jgi:hypothetical protein